MIKDEFSLDKHLLDPDDPGDAVFLIAYVFSGGPVPDPIEAGDTNCEGDANVGNAVYLIAYVFNSGPAPCADCS